MNLCRRNQGRGSRHPAAVRTELQTRSAPRWHRNAFAAKHREGAAASEKNGNRRQKKECEWAEPLVLASNERNWEAPRRQPLRKNPSAFRRRSVPPRNG